MAAPLLLLGLGAVAGVGTGAYVFRAGAGEADLKAKIGGVPAVPALAIGGGLLAIMGGSFLAPIGIGMLIGSLVAGQGLSTVKAGLDQMIEAKIKAQMGPGAAPPMPPALPGPAAALPGPAPAAAPGAGLLSWIAPALQPAPAQ